MKIKHIFMICACASCFTLSAQAHVNMLQAQLGTEATQSSSDEKAASTEVENRINEIKTTLKDHIGKVGYPTTASWEAFNTTVSSSSITLEQVNAALSTMLTQANITMPEDGKAYYIRPVNKGKQVSERSANRLYYKKTTNSLEIGVGGTDESNAIFYAHKVGNYQFVFTNNAGKYLTFKAADKNIENITTGFADDYNAHFVFNIFPMQSYNSVTGDKVSTTNPVGGLDVAGLVLLQSYMRGDKGNELHYLLARPSAGTFHNGQGPDIFFVETGNTCAFYLEEALQQNLFTTKALTVGNVNNANICTYSSPFPVVLPTGVDAYIATEQDDAIVLQKVTGAALPKNTGVILSTDEAKDYIPVARTTEEIASIEGTNKLVATTGEAIDASTTAYVLAKDGNNAVFKRLDANKRAVAQYKAYLNMTGSSLSAIKLLFGNTTTAINSAKADVLNNKPATMYDLNGRKVGKLQQGIYIVNGKKIIVK